MDKEAIRYLKQIRDCVAWILAINAVLVFLAIVV